jgi:predicted nucleotide-binding protein with TIR-like domain
VRSLLKDDAEITLWNEGFFQLGHTFIETLVNALPRFDFAVLVLYSDDLVKSRNLEMFGPRDNVIFELGLFMGRLGRSRTFIVHQHNAAVKIPSDLSGVTTATYEWPREDKSREGALGAACDRIRNVIRDLGVSEAKTSKAISDIESRQNQQAQEIKLLIGDVQVMTVQVIQIRFRWGSHENTPLFFDSIRFELKIRFALINRGSLPVGLANLTSPQAIKTPAFRTKASGSYDFLYLPAKSISQ